jgi:2-methylcitrate dehydratase PrpD
LDTPVPDAGRLVGATVATAEDLPTERLATLAATLRFETIPAAVLERARDLVLDHLGLSIYGTQLPWTQIVREQIVFDGGREEASIYGAQQRVPMRSAALVNGAAAHAIELDDTHDESLSHPGSVVIPAALAVAEALDRTGADFLTAMVAGYEAQCRVGSAIGHDLLSRGFHPPSTCGVYGATVAAARLMNLDVPTVVSALGSATSMISGTLQFTDDPAGTMIKRLHTGIPAERGVLCAQLAARGYLGPRRAIEGRYGFARVFTQRTDLARITRDLGERFEIERITVKLYACCKLFHSMLEAIGNCRAERAFATEDVVAIVPFGPRLMIDTHMEYRPASTMAAQYSLPYACAAAIALDPANPDSFDPQMLDRPDLRRLADLVDPVVDDRLEAIFPRKMAGGVRIRLRDGTELASTVIDSRSSPERPIGRDDVIDKFMRLTASLLSRRKQQAIIDAVAALDVTTSVRNLAALLRNYEISAGSGAALNHARKR